MKGIVVNQLPESICREAKRLLKLAKMSDGVLLVTSLSQAQELVSKIKGAKCAFDALQATPIQGINEISLALVVGQLVKEEFVQYWTEDPSASEMVLCLASDNLSDFVFSAVSSVPEWDPSNNTHMQHEIAISLRGCDSLPNPAAIFAFANAMFAALQTRGGGYVFGYCDESLGNGASHRIYELSK